MRSIRRFTYWSFRSSSQLTLAMWRKCVIKFANIAIFIQTQQWYRACHLLAIGPVCISQEAIDQALVEMLFAQLDRYGLAISGQVDDKMPMMLSVSGNLRVFYAFHGRTQIVIAGPIATETYPILEMRILLGRFIQQCSDISGGIYFPHICFTKVPCIFLARCTCCVYTVFDVGWLLGGCVAGDGWANSISEQKFTVGPINSRRELNVMLGCNYCTHTWVQQEQ